MPLTDLGIAHIGDKIGLDGFEEVALIALEGTQVMILGVNNELTVFFVCQSYRRQSLHP